MKDIFIDTNVAKNFTNPLDPEYKKLIKWLINNDIENPENNAYLVVSKKLLGEYYRSAMGAHTATSIPIIIDHLQRAEIKRLITFSNEQISEFKRIYFTKKRIKSMMCNGEDRDHIPVVLLSDRKMALSIDDNLIYDLTNFPKFRAIAAKRPDLLDYEQ